MTGHDLYLLSLPLIAAGSVALTGVVVVIRASRASQKRHQAKASATSLSGRTPAALAASYALQAAFASLRDKAGDYTKRLANETNWTDRREFWG